MPKKNTRIGIFAGTFDPVHAGHIAFALQAIEAANLDAVYFLPERQPRHKHGVEHFGHRAAMLTRAVKPHSKLLVLEFPEKDFTVARTLPRLQQRFPGSQLVFLMGSDIIRHIGGWDRIEQLLMVSELCVGRRQSDSEKAIFSTLANLPVQPIKTTVIESYAKRISSSAIRLALHENRHITGLLKSVQSYVKREWLYLKHS